MVFYNKNKNCIFTMYKCTGNTYYGSYDSSGKLSYLRVSNVASDCYGLYYAQSNYNVWSDRAHSNPGGPALVNCSAAIECDN